jgi:hypothetical protein
MVLLFLRSACDTKGDKLAAHTILVRMLLVQLQGIHLQLQLQCLDSEWLGCAQHVHMWQVQMQDRAASMRVQTHQVIRIPVTVRFWVCCSLYGFQGHCPTWLTQILLHAVHPQLH